MSNKELADISSIELFAGIGVERGARGDGQEDMRAADGEGEGEGRHGREVGAPQKIF